MRVVTHNAFWLQGYPFGTDRPGAPVASVVEGLARVYSGLGADLLCLQEVQSEEAFARLRDALGMDGCYTRGRELAQYGAATFWRRGAGRLVADSLTADAPVQRAWQLVDASAGGATILAANVHLLAARQVGPREAERRRPLEMLSVLGTLRTPDVVLGDFNEEPGGPVGSLLAARGCSDAAELSDMDRALTNAAGGCGDRMWLGPRLRLSLAAFGMVPMEEMPSPEPGKKFLSDHSPLWADLRLP